MLLVQGLDEVKRDVAAEIGTCQEVRHSSHYHNATDLFDLNPDAYDVIWSHTTVLLIP